MIDSHTISKLLGSLVNSDNVAAAGEKAAAKYLKKNGYRILGSNIQLKSGEVDILAQTADGKTVVIVEVKSTAAGETTGGELRPESRVGIGKQMKLTRLAHQLAKRKKLANRMFRFDVIGVDLTDRKQPEIRHHPNAFQAHF